MSEDRQDSQTERQTFRQAEADSCCCCSSSCSWLLAEAH